MVRTGKKSPTTGGKAPGKKPSHSTGTKSEGTRVKKAPAKKAPRDAEAGAKKRKAAPSGKEEGMQPPRRSSSRGLAPWAARHAAKHAEEARARAAEPPPPGSARATLRVPTGAEELKTRILDLHQRVTRINGLRKSLAKSFFVIGLLLREIRDEKLYEVRGFGSFETFLEREVGLGKVTSLQLVKVVEIFQEHAALSYGMDLIVQALAILESDQRQGGRVPGGSPAPLPLKPPKGQR